MPEFNLSIESVNETVHLYSPTFLTGRWERVHNNSNPNFTGTLNLTIQLGTSNHTINHMGYYLSHKMKKDFIHLLHQHVSPSSIFNATSTEVFGGPSNITRQIAVQVK